MTCDLQASHLKVIIYSTFATAPRLLLCDHYPDPCVFSPTVQAPYPVPYFSGKPGPGTIRLLVRGRFPNLLILLAEQQLPAVVLRAEGGRFLYIDRWIVFEERLLCFF